MKDEENEYSHVIYFFLKNSNLRWCNIAQFFTFKKMKSVNDLWIEFKINDKRSSFLSAPFKFFNQKHPNPSKLVHIPYSLQFEPSLVEI